MRRTPLRRTTHLRSVGATSKRLRAGYAASQQVVFARARGKCENPWCRKAGRDYHHIVKRSRGRDDSPLNLLFLCRSCHDRTDLPTGQIGHLSIHTFVDGFGRTFALFLKGEGLSDSVASPPLLLGEIS